MVFPPNYFKPKGPPAPFKFRVVVEVSGGVAEVTDCPDEVEVEIIDWDNQRDNG